MRLETIIVASILMDLILGDPRRMPHPVRWIGKFARLTEDTRGIFFHLLFGLDFLHPVSSIRFLSRFLLRSAKYSKVLALSQNQYFQFS